MKKSKAMKQPFPILPLMLGAGVLAGLYFIAKRSNPQLEAARRQEAAIREAMSKGSGGGLAPPSPIRGA